MDLYVSTDLRTVTEIWMGLKTVAWAVDHEKLTLVGDTDLANDVQTWLGLSPFAQEQKLAT